MSLMGQGQLYQPRPRCGRSTPESCRIAAPQGSKLIDSGHPMVCRQRDEVTRRLLKKLLAAIKSTSTRCRNSPFPRVTNDTPVYPDNGFLASVPGPKSVLIGARCARRCIDCGCANCSVSIWRGADYSDSRSS